jgi:hypothetical protein
MGRGLSELQKTVLQRALSNREQDRADRFRETLNPHTRYCDIYKFEIAADYFGWPHWQLGEEGRGPYDMDQHGQMRSRHEKPRCNHYRPRETSKAQALTVQVAISRALTRLEQRGLGEHWRGGFRLNTEGESLARKLLVNFHRSPEEVNR